MELGVLRVKLPVPSKAWQGCEGLTAGLNDAQVGNAPPPPASDAPMPPGIGIGCDGAVHRAAHCVS